jgi:hypothetical protein
MRLAQLNSLKCLASNPVREVSLPLWPPGLVNLEQMQLYARGVAQVRSYFALGKG